jgi:alkanesulfonate monooxygenase SsuD/methylene tetrahydromethanopterin reductase-like flavin-dependent oxidoreductase (luciferase family)
MPGIARNSYSLKVAGQYGFGPYSAALAAGNILADNWETYARSSREAGREPDRADWRVARAIFLADTTQEAVERVRTNSVGQNFQYIASVLDVSLGRDVMKRDLAMSNADCNLDFWLSEQIIAGDVDHALERLLALMEECGPFGTLVLMGFDWDDKASWLRNLELFATELMPALNKAVA